MNHPRRVRLHRLLLLAPLALLGLTLLGAAWLVRARLNDPDQWLQDEGEAAYSVNVSLGILKRNEAQSAHITLKPDERFTVTQKTGVRALVRAFEGTSPYEPSHAGDSINRYIVKIIACLAFFHNDGSQEVVSLVEVDGKYYLYREANHTAAAVNARSMERFLAAIRTGEIKARHKETGYSLSRNPTITKDLSYFLDPR